MLIFHQALQALPEHQIDADTTINPLAISLQPEQWEADGLVDGSGMTLATAHERAPSLAGILLEQPPEAR